MENTKSLRRSEKHNKRERFSIRKFNVGVASVVVAAFWMVGGQVASADTTTEAVVDTVEAVETPAVEEETPVADEEPASETVVEEVIDTPVVTEDTVAEEVPVEETPVAETVTEEATTEASTEEVAEEVVAEEVADTQATTVSEAPVTEESVAEEIAEVVTRTAATTYRIQYVDESGSVVKQQNYSVSEETTNAVDEPHTFNVTVALNVPAGYEAVSAVNNAGTEIAVVNNAIAAAIVEKDSSSRTIKVTVREDQASASNNNQEGYTAFFAGETTPTGNALTADWTVLNETPTNMDEAASEGDFHNATIRPIVEVPGTAGATISTEGYYADPDEDWITLSIIALSNLNSTQDSSNAAFGDDKSFNTLTGNDWYFTFAMPKNTDGLDLKVNLVDRATNTVLETKIVQPNESDSNPIVFDTIKEVVAANGLDESEYLIPWVYTTSANGTPVLNLRSEDNGNLKTYVFSPTARTSEGFAINTMGPALTTTTDQVTNYLVVDMAQYQTYLEGTDSYHSQRTGNEVLLSEYTQQGRIGSEFNYAGVAEYDNYELVETPAENGATSDYLMDGPRSYPIGLTSNRQLNLPYAKILYTTVNEEGDVKASVYLVDPDKVDVLTYDARDEFGTAEELSTENYILVGESEVIKANGGLNDTPWTIDFSEWDAKTGLTSQFFADGESKASTWPVNSTADALYFPYIYDASGKLIYNAFGMILNNNNTIAYNDAYYYYVEKGNVIVHYEDLDGNIIATEIVDTNHGTSGSAYDTTDSTNPTSENTKPTRITTADGRVYELVADENKDGAVYTVGGVKQVLPEDSIDTANNKLVTYTTAETGEVKAGTDIHLTYVYKEVTGSVTVEYLSEDGEVLIATADVVRDASLNETYTTTYPEEITTDDGRVFRYTRVDDASAPVSGDVLEEDQHVIYRYEEVKGDVVVNYVDTNGNVIQAPVTDTPSSSIGTGYDTTDNKPTEITTADGKTYRLVPTATIGDETGSVVEGTTEITYVYEEVTGDVVVNYVDEEGNVLQAPVVDTPESSTGTGYDTTDNKPTTITTADGKVYELIPTATIGNETGSVVEGTTEITYVYREVKASVTVEHISDTGEVLIATAPVVTDASVGTAYTTADEGEIVTEDGRTFRFTKVADDSAPTDGTVATEDQHVVYVYTEVKGNVVVNYVDEEGNVIQAPVVDTPESSTGTGYDTTDNKPTTITTADGKVYELIPTATIGNETGSVVEGTTEITYVYREVKGSVTVEHVSDTGEVLIPTASVVTDASVGTAYTTADEGTIVTEDGRTFKFTAVAEDSAPVEGTVSTEAQHVKYVYTEVKGDVVVNYVDTNGNVIQAPVTDTPTSSTGTSYDTTDNKPTEITTADGKTYRLVPTATIGNETGSVVEGTTEITYVYEEVTGDVVVNYVDTNGNVIQAPVTDTPTSSTGTSYDTTDNKPTTITTADGKVYRLVPTATIGNETGSVVEGTTEITYVYEEVVTTSYVDLDGNPLLPTEDGTLDPATIPGYEVVDKIVDDNGNVTHVYSKIEVPIVRGTVITRFFDEDGNEIATSVTQEGDVDTEYTTTPKNIPGYFLEETPSNATGSIVEGVTEVVYIYEKIVPAEAVVRYVDENGNELATTDLIEGRVGEAYSTTAKSIPGYVLTALPVNTDGTLTEVPTEIVYVYRPVEQVVVPTTSFVTTDGTELSATVEGVKDPLTFDGYYLTKTETDADGNVTHIYAQVTTDYVTEDGTVLSPTETGTFDPKAFDGYELVDTQVDANGNTKHVYRKVEMPVETPVETPTETPALTPITSFVDEAGNPLLPSEDGTLDPAVIDGYELVGTTVDADGNTVHTYRRVETPVVTPTTSFVDEAGNPLLPSEDGTLDPAVIDGYELVETKVVDGNTVHVYRQVATTAQPSQPVAPAESEPVAPKAPKAKAEKPVYVTKETKELPNTGEESNAAAVAGLGILMSALGLGGLRRRKED